MKTCVFIMGTNSVGKTTLAKTLIEQLGGGVFQTTKQLTICNNKQLVFAGQYSDERKYGGVDIFNQTKCLEEVVRNGLKTAEVIVCEGMYMNTFGLNLQRAAFAAQRQLIVFLYAPVKELQNRLFERSGNNITKHVIHNQHLACVSARKWSSIFVPVLSFDTSKIGKYEIAQSVIDKINELCETNITMNKK